MSTPSMETYLTGREPDPQPPPQSRRSSVIPEWLLVTLMVSLLGAVIYLLYDSYQFQVRTLAEIAQIGDQIKALENKDKVSEANLTDLKGELNQAVGSTKQEIKKTAQQIQAEAQRSEAQLSSAIANKADVTQVERIKQEADSKIGQVSTEVGGVRSEVGTVKTDLATTKRDLEGTQRQLLDVRETLTAAVAKNASELTELRRKGERDYFEFQITKKNVLTKVEDIRLVLTRTDHKKGKYNIQIIVDDNRLEKKDRTVNEPVQFLVGRNRLRYELVINWVQKDRIGGYLSIPKDKMLSAEKTNGN